MEPGPKRIRPVQEPMHRHYSAHRGEVEAIVAPVLLVKIEFEGLASSLELRQIRVLPWGVCFQYGWSVILWSIDWSSIMVHGWGMLIPVVWVVIALVGLWHCICLSGVWSSILLIHIPLGSSPILGSGRPHWCTVLPVRLSISLCIVPETRRSLG